MKGLPVSVLVLSAAVAGPAAASAQTPRALAPQATLDFIGPEIPLGPIVPGAPFSADAATTITQVLADGVRINRTVTARLFRDADGRVRREQTILGLALVDPTDDSPRIVTILDPVAHVSYVLDPRTHRARRTSLLPGIERRLQRFETSPNSPESLGSKQLEGLDVVGTRRTETIPAGRIGNDRPFDVTDERWESTALKVLVQSQHHDPRTGDVEYALTNILRTDQPRDLFAVPPDYTIVDTPGRER